MITQVSVKEVLTASREQPGIPQSSAVDDTLLAALLRRAAGIYCPCSLSTLAAVTESLAYLTDGRGELEERVNAAAEGLIVVGDLLELNQVTVDLEAVTLSPRLVLQLDADVTREHTCLAKESASRHLFLRSELLRRRGLPRPYSCSGRRSAI